MAYPDRWAAVVAVAAITDLLAFLENTGSWRRPLREAEYGSPDEDEAFLERISPVNRVDDLEAPLLAVHGEDDRRVPVEETRQFVEAAEAAGVEVESLVLESEGQPSPTPRTGCWCSVASSRSSPGRYGDGGPDPPDVTG